MMNTRLIFPIEESNWISPTVIQGKKDIEHIWGCVDYQILNYACVYDPFMKHFSNKLLDQVAENEAYTFTYGLLGYH